MRLSRKYSWLAIILFTSATTQAQLTIQDGAIFTTTGNVLITLKDIDLVNNGIIHQSAGDGIFLFTGTNDNSITGSGNPIFSILQIAKTGSAKLLITQDISIVTALDLTTGLIDLGSNHVFLQPTALLSGENENTPITGNAGSYIQITNMLNAPVAANPGNLGAIITSSQNLGNTIVRRGQFSQTIGSGAGNSILRYYDIIPDNNTALNATLRLQYLDTELNGLDESALTLWESADTIHWTNMGYSSRDTINKYVEQTGIADFSRWTLSSLNNPLPVTFITFTTQCVNGSASLSWTTAQEENSSRFEIQKSADGIQWQPIASLPAAGNSSSEKSYSYTDNNSSTQPAFYRIKEVDRDGAGIYTTVASANCTTNSSGINTYPNPAGDQLWVDFTAPVGSLVKASLTDSKGALVRTAETSFAGGNHLFSIDMKGLSPGLYFLLLQWNNGNSQEIKKILKK